MYVQQNKDESLNNVYRIGILVTDPKELDIGYIEDKIMALIWSIQDDYLDVDNFDILQVVTPNIDILQKFGAEVPGVEIIATGEIDDLLDNSDGLYVFCAPTNAQTVNRLCTLATDAGVFTVVDILDT